MVKDDYQRFILLSLIAHLLIFAPWFLLHRQAAKQEIPYTYVDYVPSYVDRAQSRPSPSTQASRQQQPTTIPQEFATPKSPEGLLKLFGATRDTMRSVSSMNSAPALMQALSQKAKPQDAIHMVGDKLEDDPLRNLLGRAITAHLSYPKLAQELALRGTATIGLTLFPDGEVVNVKLLKSSREKMLDHAAIEAIKAISPLENVNLYLKKEKYLVINIIFR